MCSCLYDSVLIISKCLLQESKQGSKNRHANDLIIWESLWVLVVKWNKLMRCGVKAWTNKRALEKQGSCSFRDAMKRHDMPPPFPRHLPCLSETPPPPFQDTVAWVVIALPFQKMRWWHCSKQLWCASSYLRTISPQLKKMMIQNAPPEPKS